MGLLDNIYLNSPVYLKAYQDGYEQAKREMAEFLEKMKALYTTSTAGDLLRKRSSDNKSEELRGG